MMVIILSTFGAIKYFQNGNSMNSGQGNKSVPPNWTVFTDTIAGYSFYYPPTSYVQSGVDNSSKYSFNFLTLLHDNGGEIVELYTLDNPDGLSPEQFIQTEYALKHSKPTELWRESDLSSNAQPLQVAGYEVLLVRQSEATVPLTGLCQQVVYIPHKNRVVVAKLCSAKRGVWELGYKADVEGEKLYFQLLNTLKLISF